MKQRRIYDGILAGVISGFFLGLFLKAIEYLTSLKVYTLLLNVDYIPIINRVQLPESIEFGIHLIISIFVSLFFMLFLKNKQWDPRRKMTFVVVGGVMIGLLLFPTTALSTRTPALSDGSALFYWMVSHTMYGVLLSFLLNKKAKV